MPDNKLLLLTNGKGTIGRSLSYLVFAHGDAMLLNRTHKDLMQQHLFSLGFTQRSLRKLVKHADGELLQPPHTRRTFALELVKPSLARVSEENYHHNPSHFINRLEFSCSIARFKFGQKLLKHEPHAVKRQPVSLMDVEPRESFLTLIEIVPAPSHFFSIRSSYQDYCATARRLREEQGKMVEEREEREMAVKIEEME
jgi:hypothetical protein